jgi:nicotinamide mononucleotide transporter
MSTLEIIATIATIVGVLLTIKQNVLVWPVSIVSVVSLICLYIDNGLYAQVFLQSMCLIPCIVGWINWGKEEVVPIKVLSRHKLLYDIAFFLVLGLLFGYSVLITGTSTHPMIVLVDGVAAFIGLLANWYLTKKILQVWKVFMVYNILLMVLMYSQGLYLIVGLNITLFLLSINGYITWKRDLRTV